MSNEPIDRTHLLDLIAEADDDPDAVYLQPDGSYVAQSDAYFEGAGFDLDSVPWGAIASLVRIAHRNSPGCKCLGCGDRPYPSICSR